MPAREIYQVFYSSIFKKNFGRLPKSIQILARKKDKLFRQNAFHRSLATHQLSGKLGGDWAYSVNREYRIHFYFTDDNHTVMYLNIGTHEIYKK